MLIVHEWARSVARRSPERPGFQKKRPQVETLDMPHASVRSDFLPGLRHFGQRRQRQRHRRRPLGQHLRYRQLHREVPPSRRTTKYGYIESVTDPTSLPETIVVSYSPTGVLNWYDEFQNKTTTDPLSTSRGASLTYDDSGACDDLRRRQLVTGYG